MYLLLNGNPPFHEKTKDATINAIKKAVLNFSSIRLFKCRIAPLWHRIDTEAKDLVKSMLNKNPKERISAKAALKHSWIVKHESALPCREDQDENLIQSLRNLKNFETGSTLQKAVLSYIASQEIDPETEKKLRLVFDALDVDKSGYVSTKELVDGYTKIYRSHNEAYHASMQVMKKTDINKNGHIDYNGIDVKRVK